MPLPRRIGVGIAALSFVTLTAWQIAARRDDWPLAAFQMYSGLQSPVVERELVRGVSDDGEFELSAEQTAPLGGARLRNLTEKLAKDPARHERFVQQLIRRYDARREARGWPALQGVRWYSETWRIQPGLAGIDHPDVAREGSLYLPPTSLLERLVAERAGAAAVATPRAAPDGDRVIELSAENCAAGCAVISDRYASGGEALVLDTAASSGDEARASVRLTLAAGRWALLLRLRSHAEHPFDRVSVALDGQAVGAELGNFEADLGSGAWLWASSQPGEPPVELSIELAGDHTLTLSADGGTIDVDQLWLSRARKELPVWSDPVHAS
jgi:hypothetical protein